MPAEISWSLAGIWLAVGFCVGLGWAFAVWLVARVLK